jgi:hypothetical protein
MMMRRIVPNSRQTIHRLVDIERELPEPGGVRSAKIGVKGAEASAIASLEITQRSRHRRAVDALRGCEQEVELLKGVV